MRVHWTETAQGHLEAIHAYIALKFSHLGTIYGPLSVFAIFILWVFYAASIFLIGGELIHNLWAFKSTSPPS